MFYSNGYKCVCGFEWMVKVEDMTAENKVRIANMCEYRDIATRILGDGFTVDIVVGGIVVSRAGSGYDFPIYILPDCRRVIVKSRDFEDKAMQIVDAYEKRFRGDEYVLEKDFSA